MNLLGIFHGALLASALLAADTQKGVELYEKGDYAQAAAELREAVKESPDDAKANGYLALALLEQDKADEAEPYARKAAELDSEGKAALARLYVAQKKYDQAEAALSEASGDEVEYVRGVMNVNRKQYDAAARDLKSYVGKKPESPYGHYYLGMAYSGLRQPDKMMTEFELFLRMKPDSPEAKKVRAVMRTGK